MYWGSLFEESFLDVVKFQLTIISRKTLFKAEYIVYASSPHRYHGIRERVQNIPGMRSNDANNYLHVANIYLE